MHNVIDFLVQGFILAMDFKEFYKEHPYHGPYSKEHEILN